jgi:pilus assembly protein CpaB
MRTQFQKALEGGRNKQALLVAVAAAVAGVTLLFVYMKRFEEEASGGLPIAVLVATQDIPLGSAVTQQMLGIRTLPQKFIEDRHIQAGDARRVIGVRVSSGVKANESVLWTDLATMNDQRRDLSSLVRNGMRAITVHADPTSSFGGLLRPGDRVDVLVTTQREIGDKVTVPLLQNLLVLAAGRDTGGHHNRGDNANEYQVNQVTLSVSFEQAQVLTLSQSEGRITLILRNPDDIGVLSEIPEATTSDIVEQRRRVAMSPVEAREPLAAEQPTIERVQ